MDKVTADLCSTNNVIMRWYELYNGHPIVDDDLANEMDIDER